MSFLAELRQQQSATGQGLTLCYLLHIDHHRQKAGLSLSLAELRDGRLHQPGRPYVVQRPHLQTPPLFLDAGDIALLQTLVDADYQWLQNSSGGLPERDSWTFLQRLLDTRRCFIRGPNGFWVVANQAPDQKANLQWIVNGDGQQRLAWKLPAGGALFFVASFDAPFVYRSDGHAIARCRHHLGSEALQLALSCFQPHTPEAVAALVKENDHWRRADLPAPRDIPVADIAATPEPVLRFSATESGENGVARDRVRLEFRYCGERFCTFFTPDKVEHEFRFWDGERLNCLQRQHEQEAHWQEKLTEHLQRFTCVSAGCGWQGEDDNAWRYLLTEARPSLEAEGFRFVIDKDFRRHYVVADSWQSEITQLENDRWQLSVQLSVEGGPVDLLALLAHLKSIRYTGDASCLRLADGRLLLLPADKLKGLMEELGDMLDHAGPNGRGDYSFPGSQLNRLNALQGQMPESTRWQGDVELLEQAIDMHGSPAMLDRENCGINAQLRPYQWQGVCWLQHLKQHRVNGLLADDMGLGKTLQTLAHLCLEHQQGQLQSPALIIAPTSLLHNWGAEIARFAPHLSCKIIHGAQRHQHWSQLNDYDVVITSYPLIVNDLTRWQQQSLSWLVLDEAQYIKNPRTRASQAVRQLEAKHRLCLSGTPVENHLGELWSIMDFLMPGCLGSADEFRRYFRKPIEQAADSHRMELLLQRIAPFMLRRTKDQVAADLPAKTEIQQTVSLADDQLDFYNGLKSAGRMALEEKLANTAQGQQSILILTALMKLRQACCDPLLLGETKTSSGKRRHCIEMIEELVAENRAILVFSQFTAMLDLLAQDLDQLGIDYLMLTGKTRQRQQLVEDFQKGRAPVFLISLKAGGVGLNLTRADTVIHYDPWWNSAAEQQAADRAHRIGQDKPVFVYKLIAEDTIEEKIAALQQSKHLLSQHVNQQAQASGERFALKLDELLALWEEETTTPC